MAVYDLEEQEKIDALKDWWKQYGSIVTLILVLGLITFLGVRGWKDYKETQAIKASVLYTDLAKTANAKELEKSRGLVKTLTEKYSGTSYASRAALILAKAELDSGNSDAAKKQLYWVIKEAKEQDLQDLARLRLVNILIDEKNYSEALSLLEEKHNESLDPLYLSLKGDILISTGKPEEAKNIYQSAFDKTDSKHQYRTYLQLKLDALKGNK